MTNIAPQIHAGLSVMERSGWRQRVTSRYALNPAISGNPPTSSGFSRQAAAQCQCRS